MDRKLSDVEKISAQYGKGRKLRSFSRLIFIMFLFFMGSVIAGVFSTYDLEPYSKEKYKLAPLPTEWPGPVVQVYSARTRGLKKILAVHTWIATKRRGADQYQVTQVIGWRLSRRGTALFSENGIPDKGWYGNEPTLLLDLRGPEVESLIDKIETATASYPWSGEYSVWPGPNSNTFTAWIGLKVPELGLDLPSTAIGKDWRPIDQSIGYSASGTGVQASLFGLIGASLGYEEGLEINVLGLSTEIDVFDFAIELPGFGRIGKPPEEQNSDATHLPVQ